MESLIYSSNATRTFTPRQIEDIVDAAVLKNSRLGITGYLCIMRNRQVFQYLEGPAQSLADLMESINSDERHVVERVIRLGTQETRHFPIWYMRSITTDEQTTLGLDDLLLKVLESNRNAVQQEEMKANIERILGRVSEYHRMLQL